MWESGGSGAEDVTWELKPPCILSNLGRKSAEPCVCVLCCVCTHGAAHIIQQLYRQAKAKPKASQARACLLGYIPSEEIRWSIYQMALSLSLSLSLSTLYLTPLCALPQLLYGLGYALSLPVGRTSHPTDVHQLRFGFLCSIYNVYHNTRMVVVVVATIRWVPIANAALKCCGWISALLHVTLHQYSLFVAVHVT